MYGTKEGMGQWAQWDGFVAFPNCRSAQRIWFMKDGQEEDEKKEGEGEKEEEEKGGGIGGGTSDR